MRALLPPALSRRLRPVVAAGLALAAGLGGAPPTDRYELAPESRFWIDGTATTGAWTCEADAVAGTGRLAPSPEATLAVPVRALDCGSRPMNRDLYAALGADAHPDIRFDLVSAEALGAEASPGIWVPVRATGTLRLAGAVRTLTLAAEGRRLPDGRVAVRGRHPLRMSAFGVTPPSHALGLIRAHDPIVARFHLVAAAR